MILTSTRPTVMFLGIAACFFYLYPSPSQALRKQCIATMPVQISCETTRGYANCSNFYEGSKCNASQCLRGYNGYCRSTQPPVKVYCIEQGYEEKETCPMY